MIALLAAAYAGETLIPALPILETTDGSPGTRWTLGVDTPEPKSHTVREPIPCWDGYIAVHIVPEPDDKVTIYISANTGSSGMRVDERCSSRTEVSGFLVGKVLEAEGFHETRCVDRRGHVRTDRDPQKVSLVWNGRTGHLSGFWGDKSVWFAPVQWVDRQCPAPPP